VYDKKKVMQEYETQNIRQRQDMWGERAQRDPETLLRDGYHRIHSTHSNIMP
jgi:hypothetical protein